jgi:DNA-binding response OmpR family regulator
LFCAKFVFHGAPARIGIRSPWRTKLRRQFPKIRKEKASNQVRILIIEDNCDAANSLRMLLEIMGHEVFVAFSGPEGVVLATEYLPSVVLSDIGLPGLDGFDVARELRNNAALDATKLIAITGCGDDEFRQRAHNSGFDFFLAKPADPTALLDLLD